MAKRVQRVGHDTSTASVFTGLEREITVDLGKKSIRVHDGLVPGGVIVAKEDLSTTPAAIGGSNDGKMSSAQATELANSTAKDIVQDGRLDAVDVLNTAQDGRLTATELEAGANTTLNGTQDTRLDAIELLNTNQDGRLDGMDTLNATQDGRLTANEAAILARLIANNNLSDLENVVTALVNLGLSPSDSVTFSRLLINNVSILTAPLAIKTDSSASSIGIIGRSIDSNSSIDFYETNETTKLGDIRASQGDLRLNGIGTLTLHTNNIERVRVLSNGTILLKDDLGVGANRSSAAGFANIVNVEGNSAAIQLHETVGNVSWEIGINSSGGLLFIQDGILIASFNASGDLTILKKLIAQTLVTGTNTTEVATTAFVQTEIAPKAPLASPTFIGTPRAPTQGSTDNTTLIATTAFVQNEITPTVVADYVASSFDYDLINSPGATFSGTSFTTSFASIGPTGSGAANIWTAMDFLPANTKKIKVFVNLQMSETTLTLITGGIIVRQTGFGVTGIDILRLRLSGSPNEIKVLEMNAIATIPVDSSRRFDIRQYITAGSVDFSSLVLLGFSV